MKINIKLLKIKKISSRVSFYYISLVLCVFGAIIFLFSIYFTNRMLAEMNKITENKISIIDGKLTNAIKQIQDLHSKLIEDSYIQTMMQKQYDNGSLTKEEQNNLSDRIYTLAGSYSTSINSILPVTLSGNILNNIYSVPGFKYTFDNDSDFI
ncbi:MAG: hypothetical protein ACYDG2_05330, partial [Ruminiclostridium sp.]